MFRRETRRHKSQTSATRQIEILETRQVLSALSPIGRINTQPTTPRIPTSEALSPIGRINTQPATSRIPSSEALSPIGKSTIGDGNPGTLSKIGLVDRPQTELRSTSNRFLDVEPNNSQIEANDLPLTGIAGIPGTTHSGLAVGHVGLSADSEDWYQLNVDGTADAVFSLYDLSADLDLAVSDSFGNRIGFSVNPNSARDEVSLTALPAGTYYIRVYKGLSSAVSSYSLGVRANVSEGGSFGNGDQEPNNGTFTANRLGTLSPNSATSISGSVGGLDEGDFFRFSVAQNSTVRIQLSGLREDLDLYVVSLSDPSFVRSSFRSGNADELITLENLSAGEYVINVDPYASAASSYQLTLTVSGALSVPTTPSASGPVGNVTSNQPEFSWISVSGAQSYEVRILNGTAVIGAQTTSGNQLKWNTALTSGSYSWQVRAVNSSGTSGWTQAVSFTVVPPRVRRDMTLTRNIVRSIDQGIPENTEDWYRITITSRRNIDVQLSRLSADFDIELYTGSSTSSPRIAASVSSGTASERIRSTTPLAAGTYYLRVVPRSVLAATRYTIYFNCSGRIAP